jgi:hypothetical protein
VYTPQTYVKESENDIRYIKKGDFLLLKSNSEFFNSFTHLGLLGSFFLVLSAVLFVRRSHIKNNSNQTLVKQRKAAKLAKKQLLKAESLMSENKKDEFYTEILTALNNYLSDKFSIPVADLSREKINAILVHKQVTASTLKKLLETLDTSEYAKYAPGAVSGDLRLVYNNTAELIAYIEQQLSKRLA